MDSGDKKENIKLCFLILDINIKEDLIMIKVIISDAKKFAKNFDVTSFDITIKNKKRVRKGTLEVDFDKNEFRLNAPCLSNEIDESAIKAETLVVLKNIFYYFATTQVRRCKHPISNRVEGYTFIDETYSCVPRESVIDLLMQYDESEFDEYKRKEKIITQVKLSYDVIAEEYKIGNKKIKLKAIYGLYEDEIDLYKKVLMRYLKTKNINGTMEDVSRDYNLQYRIEHPYSYIYNPFYAFNFIVKKDAN